MSIPCIFHVSCFDWVNTVSLTFSELLPYRKYPNLVRTKKYLFSRVQKIRIKKKLLTKKVRTKLGSIKIIFIDRCALIFREPFIKSFYIILYNQQYKEKMADVMKEKLNPLVEDTEE